MFSIHRDCRNFSPFPDSFWPDRWIRAVAERKAEADGKFVHNASAFFPFSFGPANCAGKGLAMLEMRMVVCAMIQKLDIHLARDFDVATYEDSVLDYFILSRPPLPVVVRRRNPIL